MLGREVMYSLRSMSMRPGFMAVTVLTLALGIGAVTTIFSLINGIVLRPLPYSDSDRLVFMWEKLASFENASVSYPNFLDWRERSTVFETIGAYNGTGFNLTGMGDPVELRACRVSASMFPVLRADAFMGRTFLDEEDKVGGERVTLLSYGTWQDRFGADPVIVGKVITLDDEPWTIVGVMPRDFVFPPSWKDRDIYVPIEQFAENWMNQRGNHPGIYVIGRMKPGVTLEQARAEMERVAVQLEEDYPDNNTGSRVHVYGLQENMIDDTRGPLLLLLLAVGFLLLIACSNVANLLLARATSRRHEMAVRSTLGAGARHIIELFLAESVSLWVIGGLVGILVAHIAIRVLASVLAAGLPRVYDIGIDMRVVIFALVIAFVTGTLFGLAPALRSIRPNLQEFLVEGSRTSPGKGRHRLRQGLVVMEVTLAVMLLVGAGLTIRSFQMLVRGETGLDVENVLSVNIPLPESKYSEEAQQADFFGRLLERVRALPGVVSAGTTSIVPLGPDNWQNEYHVEGAPPEDPGEANYAEGDIVSRDYFSTMGISLLSGRDFSDRDSKDTNPVIIVDEHFAEMWWHNEDPIGKRLKFGGHASTNPWMTVVGVVDHVKLYGVDRETLEQFYLHYDQVIISETYLMLKTEGDPNLLTEPVRREVLALDPSQPISTVSTMEAYLNETTSDEGLLAILISVFAASALLLASVGIYGVMSYATAERNHEIGIRMALGAESRHVLSMVVRQGMVMVVAGVVAGLILAAVLGKLLMSGLYGVTPLDPPTFIIAPLFLVSVALLASYIPARRATSVDPMQTLRRE